MMKNRKLMGMLIVIGGLLLLRIMFLNDFQNKSVHPYVDMEIVNVNKKEGIFIVSNIANKKVFYGRSYELYKRNLIGVWKRVNPLWSSSSFLDIQELQAEEKKELFIQWETVYGELNEGVYKLVKEFDEQEVSVVFRIE